MKKALPCTAAIAILCLVLFAGMWIACPASASAINEIWSFESGTPATIDLAVILSTTDLIADPGYKSFQIRDYTRAITVYGSNTDIDAALAGFGVGSIIEISGIKKGKFSSSSIGGGGEPPQLGGTYLAGSVGGFAVSGRSETLVLPSGAAYVYPSDVAESNEGNLVCLQSVSFADTGTFVAGSEYNVSGGAAIVHIVSGLGIDGLTIPSGLVNITGIVIPAANCDPTSSDSGYRLAPRRAADIVSAVPEPISAMEMVAVGNPGNAADTTGYGAVNHNYKIGKKEVTVGQYVECLNSRKRPGRTMYSSLMAPQIIETGSGTTEDPYVYTAVPVCEYETIRHVSFWNACRFANWLNNGQGDSDTETGAYTLNGYDGSDGGSIGRNPGARWVIPTIDEWYKGAYFVPCCISAILSGGSGYWQTPTPSAYGTLGQYGNGWEWCETVVNSDATAARILAGGIVRTQTPVDFKGSSLGDPSRSGGGGPIGPPGEDGGFGFRVAELPGLVMETVLVGDPGNESEHLGGGGGGIGGMLGSFLIGKKEVTVDQYTEFLNYKAWDASSPLLYEWDTNMVEKSHIIRSGSGTGINPFIFRAHSGYENSPVNDVSYWNACRFVNWLNNGQGDCDTETGAYTLNNYNGADGHDIGRNAGAKWFLPNEDEWYKAAYYIGGGTNAGYWQVPTPSAYGTIDQDGNGWEWNETAVYTDLGFAGRRMRGGPNEALLPIDFKGSSLGDPSKGSQNTTFRVGAVVEPVYGINNRAAHDLIMSTASAKFTFKVWGKVTILVPGNSFTVDDGSGKPIHVVAPGFGNSIQGGDYVFAKGKVKWFNDNKSSNTFNVEVSDIVKMQ